MIASRTPVYALYALLVVFTLLILALPTVHAAALIHGSIYDLELEKLEKAVVEISTSPKQRMVSLDGAYAFTAEKGEYVIRANYRENATLLSTEERIVVKEDGSYVFDLFLLPAFDVEDEILAESTLDVDDLLIEEKGIAWYAIVSASGIIMLAVIYLFYKFMSSPERRRKKAAENAAAEEKVGEDEKEEGEEKDAVAESVITLLKKYEGRATQKEIRRQLPLSEAKISLLLSELEHAGKIRKIKKGRGNIIILNTQAGKKEADDAEEKEQKGSS